MEINPAIEKLETEIKILFSSESSGHDIHHLRRALNLALHIQEKEGGDRLVVAVSAFLHDIHRIIQNETGKYCSPKDSLPKVSEIIQKSGVNISDQQVERILHCIEYHEEYGFTKTGKSVNDIETLILQDADNLDAIGAIGIARTFAYGGANRMTIWEPESPLSVAEYEDDMRDISTIHHFYRKLLRLKGNMNTKTAVQMAEARHQFMESFLDEFFAEWKGEK